MSDAIKLIDLKKASAVTGLGTGRLRQMVLAGDVVGVQPGGPRGKLFILEPELERIIAPIAPPRAASARADAAASGDKK